MCKHENSELREKPPHVGKYCKDCGQWLGWVKQSLDTGEVANEKQQAYAVSMLDKWRRSGCPMTVGQAGGIISLFGTKK